MPAKGATEHYDSALKMDNCIDIKEKGQILQDFARYGLSNKVMPSELGNSVYAVVYSTLLINAIYGSMQ